MATSSEVREGEKVGNEALFCPRPISEYHEDMGPVLWWKFPIDEPPYVGTPMDLGHTVEVSVQAVGVDKMMRANVGAWPGYHTHFTPLPKVSAPPGMR